MSDDGCEQELFVALGRAASKLWSDLPQEFQQRLFEEAVMVQGEAFRQPLAIYLHDRHERTTNALKAEAAPEPSAPRSASICTQVGPASTRVRSNTLTPLSGPVGSVVASSPGWFSLAGCITSSPA
jgi:hypothetical protein